MPETGYKDDKELDLTGFLAQQSNTWRYHLKTAASPLLKCPYKTCHHFPVISQ